MTTLNKKIDFAILIGVNNANPNGDPLNENRPRVNNDNFGEISPVCIKRKMRDRLQESGESIFVQSDDSKIDEHPSLRKRADAVIPKDADDKKIVEIACKQWFDVRAFGQLFAYKGEKTKKGKAKDTEQNKDPDSESEKGGEKGISIGIKGPVTVREGLSVEPISITSTQITKSVNSDGDGSKRGSDTMGMKHRVDSGTYVIFGSMNPQLATKTGFSNEDAETIKKMLPRLLENDASSARPEGSMQILKVIWWEHNSHLGQYSSGRVHKTLKVSTDGSYTLENLPDLTPEEIEGF